MIDLSVFITSFLAGIVHGVAGFGGALVTMQVLPHFFGIPVGAGITCALGIPLCAGMMLRYKKDIAVKTAVLPAILYTATSSIVISCSLSLDQLLVKRIFGIFLILLSLYYIFIGKAAQSSRISLPACLVCILISATCDGLFGIGGPLMVLYFITMTESTHAYLGTIQLFFWINSIYNTGFRFYKGILLPEHISAILIGSAGILIGSFIAARIVDKLDVATLRKVIYVMLGVSGIINLIG